MNIRTEHSDDLSMKAAQKAALQDRKEIRRETFVSQSTVYRRDLPAAITCVFF